MNSELSFFADENIPQLLVEWLQKQGYAVSSIRLENLFGLDDKTILEKSFREKKIIITQDSDFGKIIYTQQSKFFSIIYLRPGHYNPEFHIPTLKKILTFSEKVIEGSLIIGFRSKEEIKIRIRFITFNEQA